ncbi:hypothetical protein KP509_30G071200 [Ceratopteris richardii]|uniref:PsbB mRNA maturation factor Mbb1 n=1 Tax=Ceratopteris richardii TaxID=49495 RepID=A0A8T2R3J9_CERRI|nr:hypothetical protein KP509_30G071200 [Ceratopteris richardii]
MAILPPALPIGASHLDENLLSKVPLFCGEAFGLRHVQKQRLPVPHPRQNAPLTLCDRSAASKSFAVTASVPQVSLTFGSVVEDERVREEEGKCRGTEEEHVKDEDRELVAECLSLEWNPQWYPVSLIDDLDRRVPSAVTIMGRHLIVSWDETNQLWKVWDEKLPGTLSSTSEEPMHGEAQSRLSPSNDFLEDFFQDFEKRLNRTVGYQSQRPNNVHTYRTKSESAFSNVNGYVQGSSGSSSKSSKLVNSNRTNPRMLSYGISHGKNGDGSNVNGSHTLEMQNGVHGLERNGIFQTNGIANTEAESPSRGAKARELGSNINNHDEINDGEIKPHKKSIKAFEFQHDKNVVQTKAAYTAQNVIFDGSIAASHESLQEILKGSLDNGKSIKEKAIMANRSRLASESIDRDDYDTTSSTSVVLKKPAVSSLLTSEEKTSRMTDPSNIMGVNIEDASADARTANVKELDLSSSLQAMRLLNSRHNYESAKDIAKELYERYPRDTDVLMEYAYIEKQLGDLVAAGSLYSQAISAFEAQENLGYDYVRALQALGSIEARARNAKRARVLFMESIRAARDAEWHSPDSIRGASVYGLHAWARLEEQLGNWGKARELLSRAAEIQPGNAVIHQSRALLEAKAHSWGIARHHFLLAVEAAPDDVKCWHAWAIFEARQGEYKKMRELFQRALEVEPKSIHCLQAWAHQETLIGTPESIEKARSLFQRCTELDPKSLFSWQAWAVMEKNTGNYDKARELFEHCLKLNSSSVACLQAYANLERHCENWGTARKLLRKAFKLEPENAAVLMEAAFVEQSVGNMEVAEKLFVLAGMADKRSSRVRNKMFASRKEIMEKEIGRGWKAFVKRGPKGKASSKAEVHPEYVKTSPIDSESLSGKDSEREIEKVPRSATRKGPRHSATSGAEIGTVKQEKLKSRLMELSSHSKQNTEVNSEMTINAIGAKRRNMKNTAVGKRHHAHLKWKDTKPSNFQVAINAIEAKQNELKVSFKTERRSSSGDSRSKSNFQDILDALEAKQRELGDFSGYEDSCSQREQSEMLLSKLGA